MTALIIVTPLFCQAQIYMILFCIFLFSMIISQKASISFVFSLLTGKGRWVYSHLPFQILTDQLFCSIFINVHSLSGNYFCTKRFLIMFYQFILKYVLFPWRWSFLHDHLPENKKWIFLLFCSSPAYSASGCEADEILPTASYSEISRDRTHTLPTKIIQTVSGYVWNRQIP